MMRYLQRVFLSHTLWFSGLMGTLLALLLVFFYSLGWLQRIDQTVYDSLVRLSGLSPRHPDIVLVSISDKTLTKFGWPIPRKYYQQLIDKLSHAGAKTIGFNIMLSAWNNSPSDHALVTILQRSSPVVMPVFFDYSNRNLVAPHAFFQKEAAALGNVAIFPSAVTRHIEAQIFNPSSHPKTVYLPMGVELARLHLGLNTQQIAISNSTLYLGEHLRYPLEKGGLMRIRYQGPPGYFQRVPFEEIIAGTTSYNFRHKLVLVGAFSPGLADVTDSPYSDEVTSPMYGTELQAHITQSILSKTFIYQVPQLLLIVLTLLLGILSGFGLYHRPLAQQSLVLFSTVLLSLLSCAFLFYAFAILVDISAIIFLCVNMSFGLLILTVIKSSLMLNQEFNLLCEQESEVPQSPLEEKIRHTLITLYHTNQATWFCFRRCDPESRQLILQDALGLSGSLTLPVESYSESLLNHLPQTAIPIEITFVPEEIRGNQRDGYYLFLPIYTTQNHLWGLFEGYYPKHADFEHLSMDLIRDLEQVISSELTTLLSAGEGRPMSGLTRGVENKIAALSRLNKRFHNYNAFLVTTLKGLNNPLVACNTLGEILFFNEKFLQILSLTKDEDITQQSVIDLLNQSFTFQPMDWHNLWAKAVHKRQQAEMQLQNHLAVYLLSLTPVMSNRYQLNGLVMVLTDITKLHQQANYDGLTHLCNRRYFDELLTHELYRVKRQPEMIYSVVMLDIDHFKSLNDTYGHHTGDEVLSRVGKILQQTVRKSDITGRYGGEEMVILLPATGMVGACQLAEKIRKTIENMSLTDLTQEPQSHLSISLGVATYVPQDTEIEDIMRRADEAMYSSKNAGRNCTHAYLENGQLQRITPLAATQESGGGGG